MKTKLLLAALSVATMAIFAACSGDEASKVEADIPSTTSMATATHFASEEAVTLDPSAVSFAVYDTDGNLRESSEWLGHQPIVINFWGTWCPPCRREIPELVRLYDEYKDQGVEMVSFALNDRPSMVRQFAKAHNMDWVMLIGDQKVVMDYGYITGVPTTIFISKDGREIQRFVGPRPYEVFKAAFDELLQSS